MSKIAKKVRNRSGQEEMVGFVIIVIIVAVILLIALSFMLRSKGSEAVKDYEISSFIGASLQYTTECENKIEFLSLQDLIVSCEREDMCLDGEDSCEMLNETIRGILENSWRVEEESAVKGYNWRIMVNDEERLVMAKGNKTGDYKGAFQDFAKGSNNYEIILNVYY